MDLPHSLPQNNGNVTEAAYEQVREILQVAEKERREGLMRLMMLELTTLKIAKHSFEMGTKQL